MELAGADEGRDTYTYTRTGHARVGPQQVGFPRQPEVDVGVLRRVRRYRSVEGLVAQIAPRADGVRVDVDFEGELGHLGSVVLLVVARRQASALLSAVLGRAGLSPFGDSQGLDDLSGSGTTVNGLDSKGGPKETWPADQGGGGGGGESTPSRNLNFYSTTTHLGTSIRQRYE